MVDRFVIICDTDSQDHKRRVNDMIAVGYKIVNSCVTVVIPEDYPVKEYDTFMVKDEN